eukprot:m.29273 g.29273  ORF g.29273 m.29273 type:complete len:491 (+) comp8085_c0_seq1:189-1661(+)
MSKSEPDNKFAQVKCSGCGEHVHFKELSKRQHLCQKCRSTLPSNYCKHCKLKFQEIGGNDVCPKCRENKGSFTGKPASCLYCYCHTVFQETKKVCYICEKAEKKYGHPGKCENCNNKAAFNRGLKDKETINGKSLCMLCSIKYRKKRPSGSEDKSSTKRKRPDIPPPPAAKEMEMIKRKRSYMVDSWTKKTESSPYNQAFSLPPPPSAASRFPKSCGGDACCEERAKINQKCGEMKSKLDKLQATVAQQESQISNLQSSEAYTNGKYKTEIQTLTTKFRSEITALENTVRDLQRQLKKKSSTKEPKEMKETKTIEFKELKPKKEIFKDEKNLKEEPKDSKAQKDSAKPKVVEVNEDRAEPKDVKKESPKPKIEHIVKDEARDVNSNEMQDRDIKEEAKASETLNDTNIPNTTEPTQSTESPKDEENNIVEEEEDKEEKESNKSEEQNDTKGDLDDAVKEEEAKKDEAPDSVRSEKSKKLLSAFESSDEDE